MAIIIWIWLTLQASAAHPQQAKIEMNSHQVEANTETFLTAYRQEHHNNTVVEAQEIPSQEGVYILLVATIFIFFLLICSGIVVGHHYYKQYRQQRRHERGDFGDIVFVINTRPQQISPE